MSWRAARVGLWVAGSLVRRVYLDVVAQPLAQPARARIHGRPAMNGSRELGASFLELLQSKGLSPLSPLPASVSASPAGVVHGTTIVALTYNGGVVLGGDRRATSGNVISERTMEKVAPADRHSGVGISGAAGPAIEMIKLFQTELEHYEKVEGVALSLEGKANKLSQMIRANFGLAMQGLVVIPLFAGYDLKRRDGRIFKFDVTGGRYEEAEFHATGSGGLWAGNTVKNVWHPGLTEAEAVALATRALHEAADEDSATGGADVNRGIYPTVAAIDSAGYRRIGDDVVAAVVAEVDADRKARFGAQR